ncbi:MAG: type VI secretion system baseplate subunit TssK [Candidatus Eisenbacteria bacterium]|uniref:Type VI secretion system baseplate subunit TssK n=1 Tax=Eiseniibacteriota bacterium TaxID=2212470 RepID=A0A956RPW7_UNCEI|nr:type VI secretion system baseplate subunit TssK [Candidatus Eisenbacteria bacterium]
MAQFHRILWSEGLFVTPQHFQQWDLFLDALGSERVALTRPFGWGVHSAEIDSELLARGTLRLLSFRGILPGGTVLRVPDFDPPPRSVEFGEAVDIRADTFDIFLGLPTRRSGWPNTQLDEDSTEENKELRLRAKTVTVPDENSGRDERAVQRAEQNLQILLQTDLRDNYEVIPLAQVKRTATGEFQLIDEFVPPLLNVHASPYLLKLCRGLLERLSARSTQLAERFTEAGVNARDITPANLRAFLQFAQVNQAIPMLAHLREMPGIHPEEFYKSFATLVGQLCTFNPSRFHPREVPQYNHLTLGIVFKQLEAMLVELLDIKEVAHGYEVVPLTAAGEGRWHAAFSKDSTLAPNAALILTISGEGIDEGEMLPGIQQFIVTSQDRIGQKLALNLPGLPLHHLPVPPPVIPRARGTFYFQLAAQGNDWDAIKDSKNLAMQVPGRFRSCKFELLAIEGGR